MSSVIRSGRQINGEADSSVRFLTSLCFRFALHNLVVSPHSANRPQNELFRDLGRDATRDPTLLGNRLFVYPYAFRHITATCALLPRVNQFLTNGFHSRVHPAEDALPNCIIVRIPRILLLFSEADLTQTGDADFAGFTDLRPGMTFDAVNSNLGLPEAFAFFINQGINETMAHQRTYGWWWRAFDRVDMRLFPSRMVYQARAWDSQLRDWQEANCPAHT